MQNRYLEIKTNVTRYFELIRCYKADESGTTGIEYALIASLVGMLGVTSAGLAGESLASTFEEISDSLSSTTSQPVSLPMSNSTEIN